MIGYLDFRGKTSYLSQNSKCSTNVFECLLTTFQALQVLIKLYRFRQGALKKNGKCQFLFMEKGTVRFFFSYKIVGVYVRRGRFRVPTMSTCEKKNRSGLHDSTYED